MSQVGSPTLLSQKSAAALLGVSLSTIRRWRRAHIGPAYFRFGDVLRYSQEVLDSFIAQNTITPELRG
ncbi:MAG TPA: helix-turn-helix domain-containing protein [Bryobacteraceae bacterium]|nr:helix-turn-helix domain-containing protein [Bryobacteraceae bacterium]